MEQATAIIIYLTIAIGRVVCTGSVNNDVDAVFIYKKQDCLQKWFCSNDRSVFINELHAKSKNQNANNSYKKIVERLRLVSTL